LKKDGGRYSIHLPGEHHHHHPEGKKEERPKGKGTGVFYCPMHCEGDKTYDGPGNCPICGMDLVEEVSTDPRRTQFTCPMHPEVVTDETAAWPICGMDLVPLEVDISGEDKTYQKLLKKFEIAVAFTVPIFIIAMSEMIPNNPL